MKWAAKMPSFFVRGEVGGDAPCKIDSCFMTGCTCKE
jgi:hypothetical protein